MSSNTTEEAPKDTQAKSLFEDISADNQFHEISSLCMNCHENGEDKDGVTRLLLTRIPHFKEIVVMAFSCPHCGYESNEIQSGGSIQEKGVKFVLSVKTKKDLSRQVIKSDTAVITIPELDFEIPAITQKGSLNTIEGFLQQAVSALKSGQEDRMKIDPNVAEQVGKFIARLESTIEAEEPSFTFSIDDPAGNSFVENPFMPAEDPNLKVTHYERSNEQNLAIGLTPHIADIPYFKEIVLMAFACNECGFKSNEVKCGGATSAKARKLTFKVTTPEDLQRDILKSETATVHLPEIDVEIGMGTLGGRFTTIEGLLTQLKDEFNATPFLRGDSAEHSHREHFEKVMQGLDKAISGEPFTLVLDDPLANSYIQNIYAPDEDPNLTIEDYERTFDQNEELGLNDMKTENY